MDKMVCFIGHRKIVDTPLLRERLRKLITGFVENGTVNFIFGDKSEFNSLCYDTVTELKQKYPAVRRIHFRKDYEDANNCTMQFLISGYEESICPKGVSKAGRAGYIKRNEEMIKHSDICIFYYNENYLPPRRKNSRQDLTDYQPKSGTALAYAYAVNKKKEIINIYE